VNPLAGLAAVLLRGRPPAWRAGWAGKGPVATGQEQWDSVAVIATDYFGGVTALRIDGINTR
jgi:hypothetical protein